MSSGVAADRGRSGRRHLAAVIGALVSVLALYVTLRGVDLASASARLQRADPLPLAAILGVLAVQLVLRTVRWRALIGIVRKEPRVRLASLLPILLIGYLGNAVLPARLGEPIRAFLAARTEGLDARTMFGTVVLERVLDTASLAALAFAAGLMGNGPAWLTQAAGVAALVGAVVVVALMAGGLGLLSRGLERAENRRLSRLITYGLRLVRLVAAGADAARGRRAASLALVISSVCWLLDATTFWLVGQSLGLALAPAAALLIAAVTVLGTALPSAPGYLGTFELAATGTAMALGVPASEAFSLAVLAHVMTVVPTAIGGAIALSGSGVGLASLMSEARTVRQGQATESP